MEKPDGHACDADGRLKDAQDIEWLHSPSDSFPPPLPAMKRALDDEDEGTDLRPAKNTRVSNHPKKIAISN